MLVSNEILEELVLAHKGEPSSAPVQPPRFANVTLQRTNGMDMALSPRTCNLLASAIGIVCMMLHDGTPSLAQSGTVPSAAPAQSASPIRYRLSFRQAANHRVEVEATIPTDGAPSVRLMMPVWTPGSYLVREYARQIEGISARDEAANRALDILKVDKNHWTVACEGTQDVVVRYVIYGREMGVRTNWIENEFAFLTGAATFLTREDALHRPHTVRIEGLPQWPHVATSLPKLDERDEWHRVASHFDMLVDSPIVLGDIDIQTATVGSATHHLASLGTDGLWDTSKAMKDVIRLIELEQKFWGDVPYTDYWFLNLATESGGGLEHDNSCVLMTSRWSQRQRAKYVDWLSLVAHEFFHAWNVRRLRPKVLQQYDYNNEQYTRELWIAEGITSYYDELFVARAGLCTHKEYLDRLTKHIQGIQSTAGRKVQSLEESSFDTWIKFYRPDENAANSRISYYVKGSVVGMLLDAKIRMVTHNQKSLDDCLRLLWQRHRETGYDNRDFARVASEVAGVPLEEWLHTQLTSTDESDYSEFLECFGLQWKAKETNKDNPGKDGPKEEPIAATPATVGIELSNQAGKAMIDKVTRGAAGSAAGLQVGDELIGWGGYRITPDQWSERLGLYHAGDRVTATVARRGKLIDITVELISPSSESWTLVRVDTPTPDQQKRWSTWLGILEPAETTETK